MNNKNEIYFKLTTNVIIHFLKNYSKENSNILFNESECSGYKSIRFSTIQLENEFKPTNKNIGYFKNGHYAYYEIMPTNKYWCLYLNVGKIDLPYDLYLKLSNILDKIIEENENMITLYKNMFIDINANAQNIIEYLFSFLENDIFNIENNLFNNDNLSINEKVNLNFNYDNGFYIEGALNKVLNNQFERNREARKKCLEYYGTKCQICGFDFAEVYGKEFKQMIHVHHKIPLHEIREEYIVDPIKDLIPVCPNCHMILHAKENGTYTVEEIKEKIMNINYKLLDMEI